MLLGALVLSGCAHFVLHQWGMVEGAFGPQAHPAEPWLLRLHGLLAMLGLLLLGGVWSLHVLRMLPRAQQRASGLGLLALLALLILSGYGLYYGSETLRAWSRWLHLGAGLTQTALLAWHGWRGRALRRARRERPQP